VVFVVLFVIFIPEEPLASPPAEKLTLSALVRNLIFNPREHTDFAWNCLGRVAFNLGLAMSTTFTTFFFASRLGVKVSDIGGLIVILSIGGVLAGAFGALGGGWLSDKIQRRRILVLIASILFTVGVLIMAFGSGVPVLVTGSLITTIAVGAFMSVDQAIVFDVLPERDTDAGRYLGINAYATSLPQAVGPLLASAVLVIGMTGGAQNYTLLFIVAAVFTLIGSGIIFFRVHGTR
jgi:MFS family permease